MSKKSRFLTLVLILTGTMFALSLFTGNRRWQLRPIESKVKCDSLSMFPTFCVGESVGVAPFSATRQPLRRFQIVMFEPPPAAPTAGNWLMRVVGLPGETVSVTSNSLLINGRKMDTAELPPILRNRNWQGGFVGLTQWNLGAREVFVVGDNLRVANDSRYWGPLNLTNIIGVVAE